MGNHYLPIKATGSLQYWGLGALVGIFHRQGTKPAAENVL